MDEQDSLAHCVWESYVHIATKIIIILNLIACLILSQYVWISLAGNVQWKGRYEQELALRLSDQNALANAYQELESVREANRRAKAANDTDLAVANANKASLEARKVEAQAARDRAEELITEIGGVVGEFAGIKADYDTEVIAPLTAAIKDRAGRKADLARDRGDYLASVVRKQVEYGEMFMDFRRLEQLQYMQQEELEERLDRMSRYRGLRPDIQAEIGDTGPVVLANVEWAEGISLQLDKGKRDGVERKQVFSIKRGGSIIAIARVEELQNETCECVIVEVLRPNISPKAGDQAVTHMFLTRNTSGFGRD